MSLIRQIGLLLLAALLLAFAGGAVVSITSARDALETQLRVKNGDNAAALALALSQQKGEAQTMGLLLAAQFDTGVFARIRFVPAEGSGLAGFGRESTARPQHAPAWFVAALPIASVAGSAQVSDGWRALGAVEVVTHTAWAHDELWRGASWSVGALGVVAVLVALLAALVLVRMRRALDAVVGQAQALHGGEYVSLPEPKPRELRRLTRAMNAMVARLKLVFEGQAAQLDALRRQVDCDPLTGLANRGHFVATLQSALRAEDRPDSGGLVLVRLLDLEGLNLTAGREAADRALGCIAEVLRIYVAEVPGAFAGRLNGADFALALPAAGATAETARTIAETLRAPLAGVSADAAVAVGAIDDTAGRPVPERLGAADLALARAEQRGAFSVDTVGPGEVPFAELGERAWRVRLRHAIEAGRLQLGGYPVLGPAGQLLHLEAPLRIQVAPDGPFEVAARWLPHATRGRLTAAIDEQAVALALETTARDGLPRGVNLATATLADADFVARLHERVARAPRAAAALWLEVDELAATLHFDALRELGRQLRPLGVKIGLEHAGERLARTGGLMELGLDYVKLGAATYTGARDDAARRDLVRGLVTLLHSLRVQAIAEGVADAADAQLLWDCGIDAITGPWVGAQPSG
jgi:EAL domain-containing protein (putative c-di-GMP-specific phosphodiesterase class I)/GGDEF domain-containing protein